MMKARYSRVVKSFVAFLLAAFILGVIRRRNREYLTPNGIPGSETHQQIYEKSPSFHSEDVKKIMEERSAVMAETCSKQVGVSGKQMSKKKLFYVQSFDFYVCLVAKIASTFWSRALYQMYNTRPVESPFDVRVHQAYDGLHAMNVDQFPGLQAHNVSTKMLFVREPFGRLFSAYVDKLLPPNPVFWKAWGERAVLDFRPNNPPEELIHGNDTTFAEFISFATKSGWRYDVHLIPVYVICSPCKYHYNAIGKMETFEQDARYVISRLGIPEKQIRFDRMKADQEEDAIDDSTGGTFSDDWLQETLRVITREAAAQRVWRKLQIRGFISWRQNLRLTPQQRENLSMAQLVSMLRQAKMASTNKTELNVQKQQAFLEAYSTLTPVHVQQILAVYGPDFKLFGYDMDLVQNLLSGHPDLKNTGALDWSKDWDLTSILGS